MKIRNMKKYQEGEPMHKKLTCDNVIMLVQGGIPRWWVHLPPGGHYFQ